MKTSDYSSKTKKEKICRDLSIPLASSPVLRTLTLKYEERKESAGTPCTIYMNGHPAATRKFWDFAEAAKDEMNRLPDNFHYLSSEVKFGLFGRVHADNGTHYIGRHQGLHVFHPGHGPDPAVGINSFAAESFYVAARKFLRLAVKQGALSPADYEPAVKSLRAFFKDIYQSKKAPAEEAQP